MYVLNYFFEAQYLIQNKLNIAWGSTDETIITFSTTTMGTYNGVIEFYTQFNMKFGSSLKIVDTKKVQVVVEKENQLFNKKKIEE